MSKSLKPAVYAPVAGAIAQPSQPLAKAVQDSPVEQTVRAIYAPMEDPSTMRVIGTTPEPLGVLTNWMKSQHKNGKLVIG